MSALLNATGTCDSRRVVPWPNIPLLHLHLRRDVAAPSHVRTTQHRLTSCAKAVNRLQAPEKVADHGAAPPETLNGRPVEDSKHALNAFTAAFADAFKRKQADRCLKLVLDYASSLPRHHSIGRQHSAHLTDGMPASVTNPLVHAPLARQERPNSMQCCCRRKQQSTCAQGSSCLVLAWEAAPLSGAEGEASGADEDADS